MKESWRELWDPAPARMFAEGWVNARDLKFAAVRLPGIALAAAAPRSFDLRAANWLDRLARLAPGYRRYLEDTARRIEHNSGGLYGPAEARRIADELECFHWENYWGRLRAVGPRGWRPPVDVKGAEWLHGALSAGQGGAGGRGAVLWFLSFGDNQIFMRALAELGAPPVHLSRLSHGSPSRTRLGFGPLGGLLRRVEQPYLSERVVMDETLTPRTQRRLEAALKRGAAVTVRADLPGRNGAPARVFGRAVRIAPGGPSLAWKTGAELLTIHARRAPRPGAYEVVIGPPFEADRTAGRKAFAREAALELARRIEDAVQAHPEQWSGWRLTDSFWEKENEQAATEETAAREEGSISG